MTDHAPGDAARYRCPRCDSEHLLAELIDHIELAHPNLELTRP